MNVTINTDASYSNTHRVGAYAFWITTDYGRYFGSGPLKGTIESASVAELMCICKALVHLQNLQRRNVVRPVVNVHINTDSLNSIHIFEQDLPKIKKYKLDQRQYKTTYNEWLKIKRYDWKMKFRHIPSHVSTATARQYVNEWCDQKAKYHISILISQKEQNGN